ncbi:MAG: TraR/DksA C4-type zinc finger protein [Gammaproteobacteria bacterium]
MRTSIGRATVNNSDIEMLKFRLLDMKAELEELDSISRGSTDTVILDQSSVGRLSRMDAMQGQQMALETERRRKQTLLQIKAALARIDNGDFGYCASCEEEIAVGRLTINPVATRCVKCSE